MRQVDRGATGVKIFLVAVALGLGLSGLKVSALIDARSQRAARIRAIDSPSLQIRQLAGMESAADLADFEAAVATTVTLLGTVAGIAFLILRRGRRRTSAALQHSESRHRSMLDAIPDRVVKIRRRDGVIRYCNTAYAHAYNMTAQQMIGRSLSEVRNEAMWQSISEQIVVLTPDNPRLSGETTWVKPDGTTLVESWTQHLIEGVDGEDDVFAIGHDITRRAEALEQLERSEARNRAVLSALPLAAIVSGPEGVLFANNAAARLIGVESPAALIGTDMGSALSNNQAEIASIREQIGKSKESVQRMSSSFNFPSGRRTLDIHISAIQFDGRDVCLGLAVDVTQQELDAQALAAAAELQRFLTENTTDGLLRVDAHLTVSYATDSMEGLVGVAPNDIMNTQLSALFNCEDWATVEAALLRSSETGLAERAEVRARNTAEHSDLWVDLCIRAVGLPDKTTEYHVTLSDSSERHEIQQQFRDGEKFMRNAFDGLVEAVFISRQDGVVVFANQASRVLLSLDDIEQPNLTSANPMNHVIDTGDAVICEADFPSSVVFATGLAAPERVMGFRSRITGETTWFLGNSRPLIQPNGETLALSTFVDVTDRKALEDTVAANRLLLDVTLNHIDASVIAVDSARQVVFMNRAATALRRFDSPGAPITQASQRGYRYHEPDGTLLEEADEPIARALNGELVNQEHLIMRWPDRDDEVHVAASAIPIQAADGRTSGAVGVMHDISSIKHAENELKRIALHDPLTGLPNRRLLVDALDAAMARNRRAPGRVGVLFCDLDGFKEVNDTLGHDAGDELLVAVAQRMADTVRPGDIVARIGGDEFVILAEPIDGGIDCHKLAARIEATLDRPFDLVAGRVRIGGSVGVATTDTDGSGDEILAAADRAMYLRKQERRACSSLVAPR